jgi:hypothetical protein
MTGGLGAKSVWKTGAATISHARVVVETRAQYIDRYKYTEPCHMISSYGIVVYVLC